VDFNELLKFSEQKTRILILEKNGLISKKIIEISENQQVEIGYLDGNHIQNSESDFFLFNTDNLDLASEFQPTVALISKGFNQNILKITQQITGGGIAIFPENISEQLLQSTNFFRKLPFEFPINSENSDIETDFGTISLENQTQEIVENIFGMKILAQQIGIMEEEFFDEIINS